MLITIYVHSLNDLKNREFLCQQKDIISKHVIQRIAEKVNGNENGYDFKIYYLPNHAVIR